MKILINSNSPSAGAKVCVTDLAPKLIACGHQVDFNDWHNYQKYELILFMSDKTAVAKAKILNKKAVIGIMDPKIDVNREEEYKKADFLLVSSIEQKDAFLHLNKNIIIYYMFPAIDEWPKIHTPKEKIIIGYHGNKLHLHAFYPNISSALDILSQKYNIELWAIYNIKTLGKWKKGLPKNVQVKHIQWTENSYTEYLSQCDIGIVNNLKPIKRFLPKIRISNRIMEYISRGYGKDYSDYLMRYKYNTNPGRIFVFSQLHIPVVTDFALSSAQIIRHEHSGLLAHSEEGWMNAIEMLILDHDKRNKYSQNLHYFIEQNCSPSINFANLHHFISNLIINKNEESIN